MSARVRSVVSGDTVNLVDKTNADHSFQLTLAYISAPRMSTMAGFESREFLRLLLLAKPVKYSTLYTNNEKAYGDLSSPVFKSLVQHVLLNGWAELRRDYLTKPGAQKVSEELEAAQASAQAQQLGIWSNKYSDRPFVIDEVPADVYGSGRRIPAIVENVLSGDRIVLRAMISDSLHFVGPASLAGVRTANPLGSKVAAETLANRLLQRQQVRALFVAPAPFNENLPLVTLLHPAGDIALVLVSSGLAEVPNVPAIGAERLLQLRNAQHEAETKGLGIFRQAHDARREHQEAFANRTRETRVVKVLSSDTIVVEPQETVQLSSVRAPRRSEVVGDTPPGFYVDDAKEFTRKLLIGQTVRLQVDGETDTEEKRPLVTVVYGPQFSNNAALTIIRAGWATAMHHRREDLARSPFYDELVEAQKAAEDAKLGIFQAVTAQSRKKVKSAGPQSIVYASESVVRARAYLATLERKPRLRAIVDQVVGAGRLRLVVPSENCAFMAVLDGVKTLRTSDPFGEEAFQYTLSEWNQRDVQVTVRNVDKTGAFVSEIYLRSKELGHELLARGFASVHAGSANASGRRDELDEIEAEAQHKRVGMWADYEADEEEVGEELEKLDVSSEESTYRDAVLAHVTPDAVFVRYAHSNSQHVEMQRELRKFFTAAANTASHSFEKRPRRRDLVILAKNYERAQVTQVNGSKFDLELIDTGDSKAAVDFADLLPLPPQFAKLPPLASPVELQFVHRPVPMYTKKYLAYFTPLVNKPVVDARRVLYSSDSTGVVDSLNYRVIAEGLASVPVAQANEEAAAPYVEAQQRAKEERRGMWEYGDPREDEDM